MNEVSESILKLESPHIEDVPFSIHVRMETQAMLK